MSGFDVDVFRASKGKPWSMLSSAHFVVYSEYDGARARALLDSLEDAWTHNVALLGSTGRDARPITVFVTASTSRFPKVLTPVTKGAAGPSADGRDFIMLVSNDTVRAYTRHEVMHILARPVWGVGPRQGGEWFREGLGTYADGTCQGTPLTVVGRDLLRANQTLTIAQLMADFRQIHRDTRAASYVYAGSLVAYLWATRGRDGVARLWNERDTLPSGHTSVPGLGGASVSSSLDRGWRAWVEQSTAGQPGLDMEKFERFGCG